MLVLFQIAALLVCNALPVQTVVPVVSKVVPSRFAESPPKFKVPVMVFFPVPLNVPPLQLSLLEIVKAPAPVRVPEIKLTGADQVEAALTVVVPLSMLKLPAPVMLLPASKL